jgi:hypothetical protein
VSEGVAHPQHLAQCLLPRLLGNGRVQPPDGLAQAPHQHHLAKRIPLRRRFTGRDVRPVPDRIAQLPEPFEGGVFDDGFVGSSTFNMHKNLSDLRDQPAYTLAESARYLKVAPATLRSWVLGRAYPKTDGSGHFKPLIHPAARKPPTLSFWNLIEAHVLRSLRTDHGVSMEALRKALHYAEKALNVERLLLNPELRTDAGKLLLDRYGELIELSASGQIAMRHMFNEHLARVEWDEWKFPVRLYPFSMKSKFMVCPLSPAVA